MLRKLLQQRRAFSSLYVQSSPQIGLMSSYNAPKRCMSSQSSSSSNSTKGESGEHKQQNHGQDRQPRDDSSTAGVIGTIVLGIGIASLGVWQMKRSVWKEQLIANRQAQLDQDPVPLLSLFDDQDAVTDQQTAPEGDGSDTFNMRPVQILAQLDYDHEIFLGPRRAPVTTTMTTGYYVITPATLEDGSRILVNRGWVPKSQTLARETTGPNGAAELIGVIKPEALGRHFVDPTADTLAGVTPDERRLPVFSSVNLLRMAEKAQLEVDPGSQPLLVEIFRGEETASGYPVRSSTKKYTEFYTMPPVHHAYAASWFALSVAVVGMGWSRFGKKAPLRRKAH